MEFPVKSVFGLDAEDAARNLAAAFAGFPVKYLLFFASPKYSPPVLARSMKNFFPGVLTFGCTTSGEIVRGRFLEGSVVAMGFGEHALENFAAAVVKGISADPDPVRDAVRDLERAMGGSLLTLDPGRYVGMVMLDGLSLAEERILDRLGDVSNVAFVGGSAGDDLAFKATHVYLDGEAFGDAALFVLMKPAHGFGVIKTQSVEVAGMELTATRVDEKKRIIVEFDGKPAATAYAGTIGVPSADLSISDFIGRPLGLMAGGEPFVRSIRNVLPGGRLEFSCAVKEGTVLRILKSRDMIEDTRNAIEAMRRNLGSLSALINFHCILRTFDLRERNRVEAYGDVFADIPTVGFSTYGEAYLGHINQTAVMLAFA